MPLVLPSGTLTDQVDFLFYNFVGALMVDGLLDRRDGARLVIALAGRRMRSRVNEDNTTVLAASKGETRVVARNVFR
ncbi:MAG: hypothetical protein HY719_04640 [Planctomycetes bacterium]|nr:hypothetical protein [Planctomycetota bacterium]